MKVKKLLRFYFTAESAVRLIDNLIIRKAVRAEFCRGAEECAEEVAELVSKKADMCDFYRCIDGVMNMFCEGERAVLENYAMSNTKGREEHRLAVAFARKMRGLIGADDKGLAAAMEFSFI